MSMMLLGVQKCDISYYLQHCAQCKPAGI